MSNHQVEGLERRIDVLQWYFHPALEDGSVKACRDCR